MNRAFFCLPLLSSLIFLASIAAFAQPSEHAGIQSYKNGNYSEAVGLLASAVKNKEFKSDAKIWNYLGLSYLETNNFKKGRQALEKAVKLAPENSSYHVNLSYAYLLFRNTDKAQSEAQKAIAIDPTNISAFYLRGSASLWEDKLDDALNDADQIIAINPTYPQGYILSSNIFLARLGNKIAKGDDTSVKDNINFLKDARDVLRKGVEACKSSPNRNVVEDELESIEAFYNYFSTDRPPTTQPTATDPNVTPLNITSKPRASYTDAARQANVQGTIRLAVLFGANAKIRHVLILKRLGYGLDEQAIKAARQMQFQPKTKDGKPISVVRIVEYTFTIY